MVETNCVACEEIKSKDPSLMANGWGQAECASFMNDTGLTPTDGNNDCQDLELLNDCLIGNLDEEVELNDVCDWRDFMHKLIPNLHTMGNAFRCAICGLWTNVHELWEAVASYRLSKDGNYIVLTAWDGNHGRVEVLDTNTTYDLTRSGNTIILTGSDGTEDRVTVPDDDTTYTISISGHRITLTGSDGSTDSVTVPDNNTTYGLSLSGHRLTLTGSDGSTDNITLPDDDTRYQLHTATYDKANLTINAGDTATVDINVSQPSGYSDTLYPMAVAGWTVEGTNVTKMVTRYIQLVDRSGSQPKVRTALYNDGTQTAEFTLYVEVLWWGRKTD